MDEKEKEVHHQVHHHKKHVTKKIRENPWIISTIVLGILVLVMLAFGSSASGKVISSDKAGQNLVNYLNSQTGGGITLVSSESVEGAPFYKVTVSYQGQDIPVYTTKDGNYYSSSMVPISASTDNSNTDSGTTTQTQEIPKSDKPVVELFVMSYCPYGTQAEKGILPVLDLLGDKVDFTLRFVYYAMHPSQGEVEENLRQYCIQKDQKSKFNTYLECFLEEGDSEGCLTKAGIDKAKLNTCYNAADKEFSISANKADKSSWLSGQFPLFDIDKDLNQKYSVQGSPTLVINGVSVNSGRSPAAMLSTICSSFTDGSAPSECDNQNLPTDSYTAGFGWTLSTGQATNGAQCY